MPSDAITRLSDRLLVLEGHIDAYLQGNYTNVCGKPAYQFEHDITNFKRNLEECKLMYTGKTETTALTYITVRFQKVFIRYENDRVRATFRRAPYIYSLFGGSGVGKSTLTQYVTAIIAHANNMIPLDANQETMSTCATNFRWLISAFHYVSPMTLYKSQIPKGHN